MRLKLYNSESLAKEEIVPLHEDGALRIYTCGPTVYNYAHIGNFRTYIAEDLLRRTLKYLGYRINHVMNLTDVDDKTIRGAVAQGVELSAYTQPYIDAFFADLKHLNIDPADHYPRATDYISKMIEMIEILMGKNVAYLGQDGSVYYAVDRFPTYGRLSHLPREALRSTGRIAADEYEKEHVSDFVLWKAYDAERDGNVFWESPWGKGRPGWHIECSAMATDILGASIDIHAGGVDNRFPHHENEIAQSEACTCCRFVAHWMHVEHLIVDGKKMSKSLGNVYTLRDLLAKGFTGRQMRYALLQVHYRSPLNFTLVGLESAGASLRRIEDLLYRLRSLPQREDGGHAAPLVQTLHENFRLALADDLNISGALAALFDAVHAAHVLCDSGVLSRKEGDALQQAFRDVDGVLAIMPFDEEEVIPEAILDALAKRELARKEKRWDDADKWRNHILDAGFFIEDTPSGARVRSSKPK